MMRMKIAAALRVLAMGTLACGGIAQAVDADTLPVPQSRAIPAGPAVFTSKDHLRNKRQWYEKTLQEHYERFGTRSDRWDAAAASFLKAYAACLVQADDTNVVAAALQLNETLCDLGCSDPYVVYTHGNLLYRMGRPAEANRTCAWD